MRRFLNRVALLAALLSYAHAASAEDPSPQVVEARVAYAEGQAMFRAENFEAAQQAFERAYKTVDNPVVLLSIAECQVRRKQIVGAIETLTRYLEKRPDAPDATRVAAQLEELRKTPGRVRIDSMPKIAAIAVDGRDLDKLTPAEIELTPGTHTITLLARGYLPADQRVTVVVGGTQDILVDFEALEKGHGRQSNGRKADAGSRASNDDAVSVKTWVSGGVAVGAAGAAAALAAISLTDDAPSSPEQQKRAEKLVVAADISAGISAAAVITTVVLYLGENDADERMPKRTIAMSPRVSTTEGGLVSSLTF